MSVGFTEEYEILIRGSREDLSRISADVPARLGPICGHATIDIFDKSVKRALQSQEDPVVLALDGWNSSDDAWGCERVFLSELDKQWPELEIAAYAVYTDEYGSVIPNFRYSPKGESECGDWLPEVGTKADFPDEDWIPDNWKVVQEEGLGEPLPPYAVANATLSFLGDWTNDERVIAREALNTPELSAVLFCKDWSVSASGSDAMISVKMSGPLDFSEDIARNLHAALADFLTSGRREAYARLCAAMREKKLLICLTIHESKNPVYREFEEWDYQYDEAYQFLISSDGKQLLSRYEDVKKLTKEDDGIAFGQLVDVVYRSLYESSAMAREYGDEDEDEDDDEDEDEDEDRGYASLPRKLNGLQRFFAYKAILSNFPQLSEIKIPLDYIEAGDMIEFLDNDAIAENLNEYINLRNPRKLSRAVAKAIEDADAFAVTPAPPFVPASFDNRFAGKTFAVKGDEFGPYAPGEMERMITAFGGVVAQDVANGADFVVCGASMGKAFDEALNGPAALLSPEYFEDMTRI